MNSASLQAWLIMSAVTVFFFAVQLILCFKVRRAAVKPIPVYVILLTGILIAADLLGMLGSSGFIDLTGLVAIIVSIFDAFALTGIALAWAVYAIRKKIMKSR